MKINLIQLKILVAIFYLNCFYSCKTISKTHSKINMVTANITLKSESGASIFDKDAPVTSETISKYLPSKSTIQKAKKMLKTAGFEVVINTFGFTVSTPIENFEKILNVKLTNSKSQNEVLYRVDKKIVIPENWKQFIESIDLPEPVEYY